MQRYQLILFIIILFITTGCRSATPLPPATAVPDQSTISATAVGTAATAATAVTAATGFLRVQGQTILDSAGQPLLLRGVNMDNLYWLTDADPLAYATQADIQLLADLGLTVIRVALDWQDFATTLNYDLIDRYLAWCQAAGLYVVLDMHVVPPDAEFGDELLWGDPVAEQQFLDLWTAVANRYAQNPTVAGYDLYNEPSPPDPAQWWSLAARTAEAIRRVDPNHIIFVENPLNDPHFQLLADPNIVYSYHDYSPFVVSHAGAAWVADSPIPDDYAYPGSIIQGFEWADWSPDAAEFIGQSAEWVYWDSGVLTPPAGVDFATLKPSVSGAVGDVWFDDLEVLHNGVPQFVYNAGMEDASVDTPEQIANWTFWSDTGFSGEWSTEVAHNGRYSLKLSSDADGEGYAIWSQAIWLLSEPLFPIAPGDTFQVRGWIYAPDNQGGSISLGLDYLRATSVEYNREQLLADIQPYLEWANAHNVPLFVGEFGAMAGSPGDSRYALIGDKVSLMNAAGLHWALWTFRDFGEFGLFAEDRLDERMAEILRQAR